MKKIIFLALPLMLAGCASTYKTTIIDPKTGKTEKIIESSESPIATIEKSLKDKTVIVWGDGLKMSGSISPGTTENPMPHIKGEFRNGNAGVGSFHKDMTADKLQGIATIIQATKTDAIMGITKDGVSIGGKSTK
jgi:hypothetical protein